MHINVMEKFCDFFTFRPSDQNTTLTYVLLDNFCPCLSKCRSVQGENHKF